MSRGFGAGYGKFGGAGLQQQQQHQQFDPSDLGGGAQGGDGFHGTQDSAQDTPGRGSQKRSGAIVQTLTPVTVCQLNNARNTHPDDIFKVDDRELNQITLVGQIVNLSVQSTNVELDLNDGTGKIGVRMWLDVEDELGAERKWDVGSYVRVIGNLRSFTGTKSVLAFRVLPIEKYDEVTYHFLDAINVHLAVTKDPEGTMSASSTSSSSRGAASGSGTPARGGAGGARAGAVAPGRGFGRGQFSFAQNAVLDVIKAATKRSSDGCSVGEVYEALSSQITEDDIREAIEWLHAEGYLFNTIADDFFGCAE